jgi:hypothetical protein
MLVYSDNVSLNVLQSFLDENPQKLKLQAETFQELGLIDPSAKSENTLTTRGYASLFRLLYNASFLNAEMSDKILKWLAESDYQTGLRAGVPKGVKVANKFGERSFKGGWCETAPRLRYCVLSQQSLFDMHYDQGGVTLQNFKISSNIYRQWFMKKSTQESYEKR